MCDFFELTWCYLADDEMGNPNNVVVVNGDRFNLVKPNGFAEAESNGNTSAIVDSWKSKVASATDTISSAMPSTSSVLETGKSALANATDAARSVMPSAETVKATVTPSDETIASTKGTATDAGNSAASAIQNAASSAKSTITPSNDTITSAKETVTDAGNSATSAVQSAASGAKSTMAPSNDTIASAKETVTDAGNSAATAVQEAAPSIMPTTLSITGYIKDRVTALLGTSDQPKEETGELEQVEGPEQLEEEDTVQPVTDKIPAAVHEGTSSTAERVNQIVAEPVQSVNKHMNQVQTLLNNMSTESAKPTKPTRATTMESGAPLLPHEMVGPPTPAAESESVKSYDFTPAKPFATTTTPVGHDGGVEANAGMHFKT